MKRVKSTNLAAIEYEPRDRVLLIRFGGGELYAYRTVPAAIYEALMKAPSKGEYFDQYIRDKYKTLKVK